MIAAELRRAILAAAAPDADPLLRPGPGPGRYASSLPFRLGGPPREQAAALAARLANEPWIAAAEPRPRLPDCHRHPRSPGQPRDAHPRACPACAASDALHGRTLTASAEADLAEHDWPSARAALAAQLTVRLAATAGATIIYFAASPPPPPAGSPAPPSHRRPVLSPPPPRQPSPPPSPRAGLLPPPPTAAASSPLLRPNGAVDPAHRPPAPAPSRARPRLRRTRRGAVRAGPDAAGPPAAARRRRSRGT